MKTLEKLKKAAERGDAYAQVILASMYETGEGVEQDSKEALNSFKKPTRKDIPRSSHFKGYG